MRPLLLSAGLALMWFAQFQDMGVEGDVPAVGIVALAGARFSADLVGAWLVISMIRLVFALARLGWIWARTPRPGT
jgi:hypothetical protein